MLGHSGIAGQQADGAAAVDPVEQGVDLLTRLGGGQPGRQQLAQGLGGEPGV